MTALRSAVISCDKKGCKATYVGKPGPGLVNLSPARREAYDLGWRNRREGGPRNKLFRDLCPEHAQDFNDPDGTRAA